MADAGTRLNHGDGGILAHKTDQPAAATGNDQVHHPFGMEQHLSRLVRSRQHFHQMGVESIRLEHLMNQLHDGPVGAVGITPPLEHAGIATLQAEHSHVEADIGACFVDDTDHAKGHTDPLNLQAIRQFIATQHLAQRRWEVGHLTNPFGNPMDALGRQLEPVILGV